jgi:hypothetical protein
MASSAVKFTVTTHGFKEALRKLDPPSQLYAEPLKSAWTDIAEFGESAAISLAPMDRGGTIAAMQHKVSKSKVPLWAVVKTTAKRNGFAYPRVTNYSPFAQSRYRKGANPNRYWFDNAMNRARAHMGRIFDRALVEMQTRWEEG